jgi:hypothetical protein
MKSPIKNTMKNINTPITDRHRKSIEKQMGIVSGSSVIRDMEQLELDSAALIQKLLTELAKVEYEACRSEMERAEKFNEWDDLDAISQVPFFKQACSRVGLRYAQSGDSNHAIGAISLEKLISW